MLRERGSVSVSELVRDLGISSMTVRRDLAILAEEGRARRTRGGAIVPELSADREPFDFRFQRDSEQKLRIARAAGVVVQPGETLFVDSSSTAHYVLSEILDSGVTVTVVTNSLPAVTAVARRRGTNVSLIGLGGALHGPSRSFVGSETVRMIENVVVDRLLLSVTAIEGSGLLTEADPAEARVKRAMIVHARTVMLVAVATKFSEQAFNVVGDAEDVDVAYLADPQPQHVRLLRQAGVTVVCV